MKFSELKLEYSETSGYHGARVHYGEYILSVINKKPSVLYEIAVMDGTAIALCKDNNTKMYTITGNSGILI